MGYGAMSDVGYLGFCQIIDGLLAIATPLSLKLSYASSTLPGQFPSTAKELREG
jgi:hypothetical protein